MTHMTQTPATPPRKRHILRWVLIGFGAFIALIIVISVAAAGGSHTTATPASPPATTGAPAAPAATQSPASSTFGLATGQPVNISSQFGTNGGTVTVTQVIHTTSPASQYGSGPANGQYVLVQVAYTAAAGKHLDANALDWYAKTPAGQHYDYSSGNAMQALNSSQMLTAATINGGESTTGWVSFDVPAGHGTIVYAPNFQGQPVASWAY